MMLPAWIIDFFQPQGVKCLRCGMAYFDELNAGLCPMCALHVSRMEPGDLRHELEHGRGELDWRLRSGMETACVSACWRSSSAARAGWARTWGAICWRRLTHCR